MATVTQFWTEAQDAPFQAFGTTVSWSWALGDDTFYWGFAVRPLQANALVSVAAPLTAISDNDLNQTTVLTVTVAAGPTHRGPVSPFEGTLLRFTAIKVQTP
jgi:hypothetical protein